jgi:hypothetical protein
VARKVVVVRLPPEALRDIDRFLQRVSSVMKVPEASYRIDRDGTLRVEAKGSKAEVRAALARLRGVIREFTAIEMGRVNVYTSKWITSVAGGPVSIEVLAEALRASGYNASPGKEALETDAPRDVVSSLAERVKEAYEALEAPLYSRALRRAVALAYALTGAPVSSIVSLAEREGYAVWRGRKLVAAEPWKETARKLVRSLKKEGGPDM